MKRMSRDSKAYMELVNKFPLRPLKTEKQYDEAGKLCVALAEKFDHLTQGEKDYLEVLTELIVKYEEAEDEEIHLEPREMLAFLMEQNELQQKDLVPIFGSSSRISEFLSGKRDLTLPQIMKLAKRFSLSPTIFMPQTETFLVS